MSLRELILGRTIRPAAAELVPDDVLDNLIDVAEAAEELNRAADSHKCRLSVPCETCAAQRALCDALSRLRGDTKEGGR